ncbi:MAG: hypothetical protein ABFS21_06445 [Actinomycetota bacterium]
MVSPRPHSRYETGGDPDADWGSPGTFRFLWAITVFELVVVVIGAVASAHWLLVAVVAIATLAAALFVLTYLKQKD